VAQAKRPNVAPFLIFAVVAMAATGAAFAVMRYGAIGAPVKAPSAPPLPAGPLQYAGANLTETHYVASGDLKRSGKLVEASVLVVGQTADTLAHQYALIAKREVLDCGAHTVSSELVGEYDGQGRLKNTEYVAGAVGRPMEWTDFEADTLCKGKAAPAWRAAADWRAAQRAAQVSPDDLVAQAEAAPKDAERWAWVCHGAPWHWRAQSFQDCDRAVSLQPQAPGVRVDRGFIALSTGHTAQAKADFGAVLTRDPGNAAALFGRSLVEAFAGDKRASKRDRDQALAADPSLPDWVEHTFRFQISDPYRGR
jgi:hypothetical protein